MTLSRRKGYTPVFGSFGFLIYPNLDLVCPTQLAATLDNVIQTSLPEQMQDTLLKLVAVFRVWPSALFYVLSELWGSMGISLLFWQFANQITRSSEAKRFYSSFGQLGNLALVASGLTIIHFSDIRAHVPAGVDAWGETLKWLMGAIAVGCGVIVLSYYWMNKHVLTDPRLYSVDEGKIGKKSKSAKPKLTLTESFMFLVRSRYLGCIALLVLGYGISINLIEVVWKAQLKHQFPHANDYNTFMGYFSMATGITTFFFVMIGTNIIRRLGWMAAALTTPVMILITGALFFLFVMNKNDLSGVLPYTPLWLAVIIGAVQNILSKSTKYSLFDPTKEMAYIPLDQESKVKGKAAIDVVGARLGKSGGGIILQAVLMFGPIAANLPILLAFVGLVVFAWIASVFSLSKRYQEKLREQESEATITVPHIKEEDLGAQPA